MKRTAIMLLTLALAAAVFVCLGCGGSSQSPEEVAEKFWEASLGEDADAAWGLITAQSKEGITKEELVSGTSKGIDAYSVGDATVAGDEARVATTLSLAGLEEGVQFETVLLKEDGAWKVSLPDTENEINEAFKKMLEEVETSPEADEQTQ